MAQEFGIRPLKDDKMRKLAKSKLNYLNAAGIHSPSLSLVDWGVSTYGSQSVFERARAE